MRQYDAVCDDDHKFTIFSPNGQNKNNVECVWNASSVIMSVSSVIMSVG